jgi:hypothetical protein
VVTTNHSSLPADWHEQGPIVECVAYKATRLSDVVCRRSVRLFRDRLQTLHHPGDLGASSEKTWYLDRACKLEPEYLEEIAVAERRTVRRDGQFTITAKLTSGQPVELVSCTGQPQAGLAGHHSTLGSAHVQLRGTTPAAWPA